MSERDDAMEGIEASLKEYKTKVAPVTKGTLLWDKDMIFLGRTQRGYEIDFDGRVEWGCMPTESLLLSLAACMGIDMVSFLQKMKADLRSFRIDIEGSRNTEPPQYYRVIRMVVALSGEGLTDKKIKRSIELSQEKYCSVYNTLRKDTEVKVEYKITE